MKTVPDLYIGRHDSQAVDEQPEQSIAILHDTPLGCLTKSRSLPHPSSVQLFSKNTLAQRSGANSRHFSPVSVMLPDIRYDTQAFM